MTPQEPFALLGMAPTMELVAVKRAYFEALARHPPHQDPEGFQRVRAAYEALTRPGALAAAYLASPVDVGELAAQARERFDAALKKASEAASAARAGEEAVGQFVERCSRMRWDEVLLVCAGKKGSLE
jgi:curved DNA-binding protein CbpA